MDPMATAFTSNDYSQKVLVCSSADGRTWMPNTTLGGESTKFAPSLATFIGRLWLAFTSNNNTQSVQVCSSADGTTWTPSVRVGQESTKFAPSLATFNGRLWLAFTSNNNTQSVQVSSSADGTTWTPSVRVGQESTKFAPSLATFNGRLWLAFTSNNNTQSVQVSSSADGTTWTPSVRVGQESTKFAPSLATFNGRLWLAFTSNNNTQSVQVSSSADGTTWTPSVRVGQESTKFAPSLATFNGRLWLAFTSNNNTQSVQVSSSADGTTWSPSVRVGQESTKFAPALWAEVLNVGQLRPLYQVLTVVYAPPGTNGGKSSSQVDYGTGSTMGTKTTTSHSFKKEGSVTATCGVKVGPVGVDASFTVSKSVAEIDTASLEIKKSVNYDIKVSGPAKDGIDHDHDLFYLWLNPLLDVTIDSQNNVSWSLAADGPTMDIQYVYAGWLKNPDLFAKQNPGTFARLKECGLTSDDFAQILALDPFASENAAIDPIRYQRQPQSFPYEPPYTAADAVPTKTQAVTRTITSTTSHVTQTEYKVSATVSGSYSFTDKITGSLKVSGGLTWTDTSSTDTTHASSQSATVTIGGPAYGYTGPTDVIVYWDGIFQSFMFAFPDSSPTAVGTVLDSAGRGVAHQAVTLVLGGRTFQTLTGPDGSYRLYGTGSGQGKVSVSGQEFTLRIGPGEPKATLRLGLAPSGNQSIASVAFPGVHLRMDGSGLTQPEGAGGGTVNCQYGVGPWEKFRLEQQGDGTVAIASVAFPGVHLRMDGNGLTQPEGAGGGTVNCQYGVGPWEKFRLEQQGDGTVAIASVAFPGVHLRMDGNGLTQPEGAGGGTVNCQYGVGPWEKFQLTVEP